MTMKKHKKEINKNNSYLDKDPSNYNNNKKWKRIYMKKKTIINSPYIVNS